MTNTLTAQSLFRNSPEYLEKYQVALENVAGQFNQMVSDPVFFDTQIKPILINDQSVRFYAYKRLLSEMIVFNSSVKFSLARLAMTAVVSGENPRLTIFIDNEGKLNPISELDILQAVTEQFNDDNLLSQLLSQNILKVTALFSN